MEKKIEIISEELIKPAASQTFCHPDSYHFSVLDQLTYPVHTPIFLYYPKPANNKATDSSIRPMQLRSSLSKILADFYPFSGRINGNISINCNDDGVLFVEAFAHNYNLQDMMLNYDPKILRQFVPQIEGSLLTTHVLLAQSTFFECGGMILGLLVSHKLCDATSACTFINGWAAMTQGNSYSSVPDFTTAIKIFPPLTKQPLLLPFADLVQEQSVSKIFLFDPSSIANLKSKCLSKEVLSPTRVEAVTALIWKCVTTSSKSPSNYVSHAVNFRKRLVPSLPSWTVGNLVAFCVATKGENDKDLQELATILRKSLLEFPSISNGKKSSLTWDVALDPILENCKMFGDMLSRSSEIGLYHFVSLCGIPFYEADFGWGKPTWMSLMEHPMKNTILMIDNKDGGIEASVCLEAKHMAEFEQNPDLLAFASNKLGSG